MEHHHDGREHHHEARELHPSKMTQLTAYHVESLSPRGASKTWAGLHTDDDIQAAVTSYLADENDTLKGKTLHDSIVQVSRWLGAQIQQEREGWAHKVKAAIQEIETHRREALMTQGVTHECVSQLKLLVECCGVDPALVAQIGSEEDRKALPMYIECLAELINALVEDRIECLQVLQAKESDRRLVHQVLRQYVQKTEARAEHAKTDYRDKLIRLERENSKLHLETNKIKKQLSRLREDHDKMRMILQVMNMDDHQPHLPPIQDRDSPPSAPSPADDSNTIHLSEDKLIKLRRSAKRLKSSLHDALQQIDNFRAGKRKGSGRKANSKTDPPTMHKLKPLLAIEHKNPTGDNSGKNDQRSSEYDFSTAASVRAIKEKYTLERFLRPHTPDRRYHPPTIAKSDSMNRSSLSNSSVQRTSVRHDRHAMRGDNVTINSGASKQQPTFRNLVRSLDEMRVKKAQRYRGGQKISKCLRCSKLYAATDNHKKACCYHSRNKQRVEEYTPKGRLTRVSYIWQCCQQDVESAGCCYGKHI